MTIEKLKQYRSICAEIEEKTIELNGSITRDTVMGSDDEFPYIQHSIEISGVTDDTHLMQRISQLKQTKLDIESFVANIDDSLTRRIFEYRYIKGKALPTWQSVAIKIGGGNTSDSIRKAHERFLKRI